MQYIIFGVKNNECSEQNMGGKAKTLVELKNLGFNVPDFFIIPSDIHGLHLVQENIFEAYDHLDCGSVAVRSSAIGEDGLKKSFAGQYKSVLNVSKESLISAIEECLESLNTAHALFYSQGKLTNKMAVIVQKMVFAEVSGVAFSADPVKNDKSVIIIESVNGQCDSLVSGMVTPNHYVVNKGEITEGNIPDDIKKVAEITKEIESKLGYPIDVEWAIQNKILYILQARPITTI